MTPTRFAGAVWALLLLNGGAYAKSGPVKTTANYVVVNRSTVRFMVNPDLPPFLLKAFRKPGEVEFRVWQKTTPKVFDSFIVEDKGELPALIKKQAHFKLNDLNFDGHLDLAVIAFEKETGRFSYEWTLFDVAQNKFVYDESLKSIDLTNAVVDQEKKEIRTISTNATDRRIYTKRVYILKDNKFGLVQEEAQTLAADKQSYRRTFSVIKNGQLQLEGETELPPEQADLVWP